MPQERLAQRSDPCNARHWQEFDNENATETWSHRLLSGKAVSKRNNEHGNVCDVKSVIADREEGKRGLTES